MLLSVAEANYIRDPTSDSQLEWLSTQRMLNKLLEVWARNKQFFQRMLIWAEGVVTGRLLAQIVGSQSNSTHVSALKNGEREINTQTNSIVSIFKG